jgi:hypothetical protein
VAQVATTIGRARGRSDFGMARRRRGRDEATRRGRNSEQAGWPWHACGKHGALVVRTNGCGSDVARRQGAVGLACTGTTLRHAGACAGAMGRMARPV